MKRNKDIEALLRKVDSSHVKLVSDYQKSLDGKIISEELKVDIKNIFENLRSCLDYLAHEMQESCTTGVSPN